MQRYEVDKKKTYRQAKRKHNAVNRLKNSIRDLHSFLISHRDIVLNLMNKLLHRSSHPSTSTSLLFSSPILSYSQLS
jgi:hypothetical protein